MQKQLAPDDNSRAATPQRCAETIRNNKMSHEANVQAIAHFVFAIWKMPHTTPLLAENASSFAESARRHHMKRKQLFVPPPLQLSAETQCHQQVRQRFNSGLESK